MISDSENGSTVDKESSSSKPKASNLGLDSGRDSPGSYYNDNKSDDPNNNGGDHGGSNYQADPTLEQSIAAQAVLQEVY
jgi:hypothetical protein